MERDGEMNRVGICEKGSQFFLGLEVNVVKLDNMVLMVWYCVMVFEQNFIFNNGFGNKFLFLYYLNKV